MRCTTRCTGNGQQRPISIPALEDKIVQKVVVDLMNAIYEQDFLDCSYGFRPGRGQHQALDEVRRVICTRPTEWILEIDIRSYFDKIVRGILIELVEKRVTDGSVLRLIRKWIKVGVIEDGKLLMSETGTGQGQPISPLLANIYLHHALDEWFEEVVKPRLKGEATATNDGPPETIRIYRATCCVSRPFEICGRTACPSLLNSPEVRFGCDAE
jgi:group II intron reverse transcriptase/maturase